MRLFSPDAPMMQALTRICDIVILNMLFFLTCLPIVTIGAANAALYDMCQKMLIDEEGGIFKGYFKAFGRNFRQSTGMFLIFAGFFALTGFNMVYFGAQQGPMLVFGYLFLLLLVVGAMVWSYAFPLVCRFQNTIFGTLRNALLLSIAYLPRTLIITAMNLLPLGLFVLAPQVFFEVSILWPIVYFGAIAYVNSLILQKVLKSLVPEA